jgi:hypothetical protein
VPFGASLRRLIACVCMSNDADGGVIPQHPFEAAVRGFRSVSDDHHAGMLRKAHADATAVVQ